jgi:hypothetical protein
MYVCLPFPVFLPEERRKRHLSAWLPRYLPASSLSGDLLMLDFSERMPQAEGFCGAAKRMKVSGSQRATLKSFHGLTKEGASTGIIHHL